MVDSGKIRGLGASSNFASASEAAAMLVSETCAAICRGPNATRDTVRTGFHVVSCERMLAVRSRCAGRVVHLHARARSPDARETAPRGDAYLGCLS